MENLDLSKLYQAIKLYLQVEQDQQASQETLALSAANNYLAINLHRLLAEEKQNVFFSPFSISTALAMLFCGSRAETASELKAVLGYEHAKIEDDKVASAFADVVSSIEQSPEDYVLAMANCLMSQKDFEVKDEYKSLLNDSFKAMLQEVDFRNETEEAVNQVNEWVKEKTHDMIPQLLDSLDESTVILLLNAVYFKGKWLNLFQERATFLQYFYNQGIEDNAKQIDMMHLKEEFPYVEKESFKALQLPYKGDEIAMMVLLPNSRDGLEDLESKLTPDLFRDLKQQMRKVKVELALPKFKLEYSKSLKECFQKMGLNKAFQSGAEFGGISDCEELAVSEIIHKAVLDVNEEGSKAAAATVVSVKLCCITFDPEFIVDHPFIFTIYNTKSDLILFMGRDQQASQETLALSAANNYLAINLHRLLAEEKQNVFFSPFSISTALAMLFCGSRAETASELKAVLGYEHAKMEDDKVASAFADIVSSIEQSPEDYVLAMANCLMSQKDFEVKDEYKSLLNDSFKAMLQEVDFRNETEEAVNQVNEWVKEKTHEMIPQLLDSLDESTAILLLNAVYFKGKWLNLFQERATFLQYFYNQGIEDNAKQVDMMHLKEEFPYVEKESFKALQLPYKGDEIAMMVLLPNSRDGLEDLESKLTPDLFRDLKQQMRKVKVELALPKFKLEYSKSLKECFQKMGLNKAFQRGAEFGGISDCEELAVSEIIHKAVLDVNEEGSEAAAATVVGVMLCCLTFDPEFIVDHPFIFTIYNTKNDIILFMGRVDEL
ncbi:uncharacterized protein LOC129228601 [Uloborus diversus]|uniref:uncharacterized protein LOC129228601 n=1 Tax=Uloborus diversus TaxID=327109 RepID=UPI0024092F02|nr:uncharacterized protein LOC129228601 [Uloborus diversus]